MCYRKPGPRCSSHAALSLANAKQELEASHSSHDASEYFSAKDKEREAQTVFDATPAGLKIMEDELLLPYPEAGLAERYTAAKMLRKQQMDAVKKLNLTSTVHDAPKNEPSGLHNSFAAADTIRQNVDGGKLQASLRVLSEKYLPQLSDDELAQLRWMTDYGSMEANKHIAGANDYSFSQGAFTAEDIEERMQLVDSALGKYRSPEPVITYRGVREASLPQSMQGDYRVAAEDKRKAFLASMPVGSVVASDFFMPTSFQPHSSVKFADFNVVMEIKSSSAAPVNTLSVSSQEHEGLLPRKLSLKVAGVQENVKISSGNINRRTGELDSTTVTIIQLEEVAE